MADRIVFGAAAIPEPERAWLAAAEKLPIESIWQGGHVLPPTATGEAITRLALLTAWTERVRIGTAVLVLPLYQPVVVAKQLGDLDARSGGRVTVGVGAGGEFVKEFEAVGVPLAERGARLNEGIEVMRKLWSGDAVTHTGRFYPLQDIQLRSVKLPGQETSGMQRGGPPIVICGRKEAAMRRAARLGQGWMPYLLSPNGYRQSVETIQQQAALDGRALDGFEWMMFLYCSVRKDPDRAHDDVAKFLGSAYGDKPRDMLDRIAPSGTPEQVAERLQQYVDAGVRHFVISPAAHEDTLEVVTLAANEVLPRLQIRAADEVGA